MADIDLPALKDILWHKMHGDLKSLVPWFTSHEQILCPVCFRPLRYDDFSLEHIIPKQVVADDPDEVRAAISRNERSGMTLLCRKPLLINQKIIYNNGCNSWKGKHFDPLLKDIFKPEIWTRQFTSQHHVALFCAGYLGLVRKFGYQIALMPSGLLMRNQFFHPHTFVKEFPIGNRMVLTGDATVEYSEDTSEFWSDPFRFSVGEGVALTMVRNIALPIPISRDPTSPLARVLPYAPSRFKLRPDLRTAFD